MERRIPTRKQRTFEERITERYGPIKLKRGRWYLIDQAEIQEGYELWHQCEKGLTHLELVDYKVLSDYDSKNLKPSWRCSCNAQPPDSIVTVWCLMEPEKTSEIVQDELVRAEVQTDFLKNEECYIEDEVQK